MECHAGVMVIASDQFTYLHENLLPVNQILEFAFFHVWQYQTLVAFKNDSCFFRNIDPMVIEYWNKKKISKDYDLSSFMSFNHAVIPIRIGKSVSQ